MSIKQSFLDAADADRDADWFLPSHRLNALFGAAPAPAAAVALDNNDNFGDDNDLGNDERRRSPLGKCVECDLTVALTPAFLVRKKKAKLKEADKPDEESEAGSDDADQSNHWFGAIVGSCAVARARR